MREFVTLLPTLQARERIDYRRERQIRLHEVSDPGQCIGAILGAGAYGGTEIGKTLACERFVTQRVPQPFAQSHLFANRRWRRLWPREVVERGLER